VRAIWIIAKMTFREAIRRRIVLTGLLLGLCFIVLFSAGFQLIITQIHHTQAAIPAASARQAMMRVAEIEGGSTLLLLGLYAVAFLSVAMAALLGADTLAGEIGSGTIQTIVAKPIRRLDVVLGKWLGFAGLLGMYLLLLAGGTLLSVLIQIGYIPPHLPAGLALMYLESLLIMTVSLACSSAFSGLATGGVVFGLYGLAFLGGWIEQFGAVLQSSTAIKIGIIASLIIPSEAMWRRAAFEMQTPLAAAFSMSPFVTISVPSALMIWYAVLYLLVTLALAVRIFQNRDL
jgi:Cu-processing system permease protein